MLDLRLEYEHMKEDIDSAIKRCLEHQRWILGPEVKELEDKVAEYIGVKHCIGVSSGTDALVLSLRALAIKLKGKEYFDRSDRIITTPFTFTATGDAILRAGATPVFVDIDPVTYNLDPKRVREYLTSASASASTSTCRVVGILPVHLYGQACDMDEIMSIADRYKLFVLEDVAQAFGGSWKVKKLGSIGTLGTFSFFPSKNLGGFGDGGMVAVNDDGLAGTVTMLLKHGGKDKYNVDHIGYNARLDTLQAAVLLAKLKYVDEFNTRRHNIAEIYTKGLSGVEGLVVPYALGSMPHAGVVHVFHQYTVRVTRRDELQNHLKEKEISTMVYYPVPLHKMGVFQDGRSEVPASLKNAEDACCQVLSLPIEPLQREEETAHVVKCVGEFCRNVSINVGTGSDKQV